MAPDGFMQPAQPRSSEAESAPAVWQVSLERL
jgi:hypothetical protein